MTRGHSSLPWLPCGCTSFVRGILLWAFTCQQHPYYNNYLQQQVPLSSVNLRLQLPLPAFSPISHSSHIKETGERLCRRKTPLLHIWNFSVSTCWVSTTTTIDAHVSRSDSPIRFDRQQTTNVIYAHDHFTRARSRWVWLWYTMLIQAAQKMIR